MANFSGNINLVTNTTVLPRPGAIFSDSQQPIQAQSEAAFVETFGQFLPLASYLQTPISRAAYYLLPPTPSPSAAAATPHATTDPEIERVVLVHGVTTPALGLQPLANALKAKFPKAYIVLIDLWGHGLSDTPLVAHEPSLFHSLLASLMEHLDWRDAHFVGYSFGGSAVVTFAPVNPHRVSSFVAVAPAGLIRASSFDERGNAYIRGGDGVSEEEVRDWVLETLE